MSKQIVKTSGDFELYDMFTGDMVTNTRPCVVTASAFIGHRVSIGQLTLVADDIGDHADDADFADVLESSGGDVELAVEAYKAELVGEIEETPEQAAARKKAAKEKKAADKAAAKLAAGA